MMIAAELTADDEADEIIDLEGVWRLWCEHPGPRQIQDDPIPPVENSNPDHVFEIHPLVRVGSQSVVNTLQWIEGYTPKDAARAFEIYDAIPCEIVPDAATQRVSIITKKVGYNYVDFIMRVEEDTQFESIDGRFVRATPLDLDGNPVSQRKIRMVLPRDSAAEQRVRGLRTGDTLRVLGMPRIDLAVVSWRIRNAAERPEALTWKLPYEMVICGVKN